MIFYLRIVVNTVGEQPDIEGNKNIQFLLNRSLCTSGEQPDIEGNKVGSAMRVY